MVAKRPCSGPFRGVYSCPRWRRNCANERRRTSADPAQPPWQWGAKEFETIGLTGPDARVTSATFCRGLTGEDGRGSAKSFTCGLTCGNGEQWPESGLQADLVAPYLQGDRSPPRQVSPPWRSSSQRHKHIGHPTASSLRRHPRSSEPWLTTLPTPCLTPALHKPSEGSEQLAIPGLPGG